MGRKLLTQQERLCPTPPPPPGFQNGLETGSHARIKSTQTVQEGPFCQRIAVANAVSGPKLLGGRTQVAWPKATEGAGGGAKLKLPPFYKSEWEAKRRSIATIIVCTCSCCYQWRKNFPLQVTAPPAPHLNTALCIGLFCGSLGVRS